MIEILSVYDQASSRYMDPFAAPTLDFSIRGFKEACGTEGHQFAKFPEDYALYHVGSFDPELGIMKKMQAHKIAQASSFVGVNTIQQLRDSLAIPPNGEDLEVDRVRAEGRA